MQLTEAHRLLRSAGYRIMRSGGLVQCYDADDAQKYGKPVVYVSVWPK